MNLSRNQTMKQNHNSKIEYKHLKIFQDLGIWKRNKQ